jgi:hypothetical protein
MAAPAVVGCNLREYCGDLLRVACETVSVGVSSEGLVSQVVGDSLQRYMTCSIAVGCHVYLPRRKRELVRLPVAGLVPHRTDRCQNGQEQGHQRSLVQIQYKTEQDQTLCRTCCHDKTQ